MRTLSLIIGVMAISIANAERVELRRNTVLEGTADQNWSLRENREGDRVSVTIQKDHDLPRGTQILGTIERIEPKYKDRPGYMDIRFERMMLPDGQRVELSAIPIPLNAKGIRRDRDGRLIADGKKTNSGAYVGGGFIGGLILGALIKKPFEGAFIGTLAGVVLGEAERQANKDREHLVAKRGSSLGILLENDLSFDWSGRFDRYDDRNRERDNRDWNRDQDRDNRDWDRNRDRDRDRNDRDRNRNRDWEQNRNNDRWEPQPQSNEIRYGNRNIIFDRNERPFRDGNTVMVPLHAMARHLGVRLSARNDGYYLDGQESSLFLQLDSDEYRMNRNQGKFGAKCRKTNGAVYAPLEAFARVSREPIYCNGTKIRY